MREIDPLFDFEYFCEYCLRIKSERGEMIPLIPNSAQKRFLNIIKERYGVKKINLELIVRSDFVLRMVVLKARQQGISTIIQALIFWVLYLFPHQKALTLGHKIDASNNLFDMYNRYYKNLLKDMKRPVSKSNEKKLQYSRTESENKIDTAGAGEIGRSDTLQWLHATEVAFYPDQKVTFVGLMQGAKNARAHFIESTAKGYNLFRDFWYDAVNGHSNYIPVFLSWIDFPEYITEALRLGHIKKLNESEKAEFIKSLGHPFYNEYDDEEKLLMNKYGASIEQLQWRRYAIDNLCMKDIEQFHQEYPRDPEEAFIASGKMVLNKSQVQANLANSKSPLKIGDLIYKKDGREVEFVENPRGFIKIWTEPEEIEGIYRFAAGSDVAEGLEQGDYSTIRVLDRVSNEVHLTWHGHIDADVLGEEIHKIYLYLKKDCHFAIEKNNHGLSTLIKAFDLNVALYSKENFNRGYELRSGSDFGHVTSQKSKKRMVDIMIEWVRDQLFTDYDAEFWKEALTFVRNARGQCQAEGKDRDPSVKNYDDRIIAEGLMLICDQWMPTFSPKKKREPVARSYILEQKKPKGITKF